ncbi:DUF6596 domain-containing protein [Gemmatimonas aurantiaca]|uniref:RNA polymerase sigma factor n=1 Tax=Gemmatimonas aurantiaca TaxID=173480 RepID=UPI00301B85AC
MADGPTPMTAIEHLLRDLAPQVLAVLARRHGDFADAEDAVQEALIAAAEQWAASGVPANPSGWLYHVATRRYTDRLRSEIARQQREHDTAVLWAENAFIPPPDVEVVPTTDDTLTLLLMCCHPVLTTASAAALTLRAVGGLTTTEIARAYLVPSATMGQRISRAKHAIRQSRVPFAMPTLSDLPRALVSTMQALYLLFNEGHTASSGDALLRIDLSAEAIRLTRLLHALVPSHGEVAGLLALMLLTHARRDARTGPHGELIPLDEQDRTRWNRTDIAEGIRLVEQALTSDAAGPYGIQAAIAALHAEAPDTATTDWAQILALYTVLEHMTGNPMVSLNRTIAVAMVDGPHAALSLLDTVAQNAQLADHHRVDAVRAHFHDMMGNHERAAHHYRLAAERTTSLPERHHLIAKAQRARHRVDAAQPME